jgi:hypothetical protein
VSTSTSNAGVAVGMPQYFRAREGREHEDTDSLHLRHT